MKTNVDKQNKRKPGFKNNQFRVLNHTIRDNGYSYEQESIDEQEELLFLLHYAIHQNLCVDFELEGVYGESKVVGSINAIHMLKRAVELDYGRLISFDDVLRARILYH